MIKHPGIPSSFIRILLEQFGEEVDLPFGYTYMQENTEEAKHNRMLDYAHVKMRRNGQDPETMLPFGFACLYHRALKESKKIDE